MVPTGHQPTQLKAQHQHNGEADHLASHVMTGQPNNRLPPTCRSRPGLTRHHSRTDEQQPSPPTGSATSTTRRGCRLAVNTITRCGCQALNQLLLMTARHTLCRSSAAPWRQTLPSAAVNSGLVPARHGPTCCPATTRPSSVTRQPCHEWRAAPQP